MHIQRSTIRNISFWQYHIVGWTLFTLLQLFINGVASHWQIKVLISISLQMCSSFFLLIGMRKYFQTIPYQTLTLISLIVRMVAASFVLTCLWWCSWFGIEYCLFGAKLIKFVSTVFNSLQVIALAFPYHLGWSALYFGIKSWRDWFDERNKIQQAEESVHQAQWHMLRYQLNPHFLFNTLNAIRALVDENTKEAKQLVTDLSEFLRYSLVNRNKPFVTLKDELDAVRLYVSIEQMRYDDKFQIVFDVEPQTEVFVIPSFTVFPLVEDVIKCGMQSGTLPLKVSIGASQHAQTLHIAIRSSGRILPESNEPENGIGQLKNRLQTIVPGGYTLDCIHQDGFTEIVFDLTETQVRR